MPSDHYDLIVIGGGPAGGSAAAEARRAGAQVALIEAKRMGGTCLNAGCDPTKTLLYHAETLQRAGTLRADARRASWPAAVRQVRAVVNEMRGGDDGAARESLRQQGIAVLEGHAAFHDPYSVSVDGRTLRAASFLIATGTRPAIPDIPGLAEAGFITNEQAPYLASLPRRIGILGGGPLAVEFAQIFARFGARVTIFEQEQRILTRDEPELADRLAALLEAEGIDIVTGASVLAVRVARGARQVRFRKGRAGRTRSLTVDELLVATGRSPNTCDLGLERAGVALDQGDAVTVDRYLRTSAPHIWAAGDVAGGYQFTHVASVQGRLAARNALGRHPEPFDDSLIPWVTYTSPALAHIGRTEQQLRQAGVGYQVARADLGGVSRAVIEGATAGGAKVLIGMDQRILGAHILSPRADDLIVPLALAMRAGLPASVLGTLIVPYPSLGEVFELALGDASRDVGMA